MKKLYSNILFYIAIALIILIPLAIAFQDVFPVILKIGGGSIITGILLFPFVILGCINIFRGIGAVLTMDENKFGHKIKGWKFYLYLVIHLGGYFALFYAIIKCL